MKVMSKQEYVQYWISKLKKDKQNSNVRVKSNGIHFKTKHGGSWITDAGIKYGYQDYLEKGGHYNL